MVSIAARGGGKTGKGTRAAPADLSGHAHLLVVLLTGGAADEAEMRKVAADGAVFDALQCCEGRIAPTVQARFFRVPHPNPDACRPDRTLCTRIFWLGCFSPAAATSGVSHILGNWSVAHRSAVTAGSDADRVGAAPQMRSHRAAHVKCEAVTCVFGSRNACE